MSDEEEIRIRKHIAESLSFLKGSPGGKILLKHIDEEIIEGWDKFIALPADKKTSKTAYDAMARYKVLKNLKEWIDDEIRMGE